MKRPSASDSVRSNVKPLQQQIVVTERKKSKIPPPPMGKSIGGLPPSGMPIASRLPPPPSLVSLNQKRKQAISPKHSKQSKPTAVSESSSEESEEEEDEDSDDDEEDDFD